MMDYAPIPVNVVPPHPDLRIGDEIIIEGVKIIGPRIFKAPCTPGEETLLIVSDKPSVFVLRGKE